MLKGKEPRAVKARCAQAMWLALIESAWQTRACGGLRQKATSITRTRYLVVSISKPRSIW